MKARNFSSILIAMLLLMTLFFLAACNKNNDKNLPVYSISISETSLEMQRYGKETLSAKVYSDGAETNEGVEWISSDNNVATVQDGTVSAVGAGETKITASAHGVKADCTVVVIDTGAVPSLKTDVSAVSLSLVGGAVSVSAYVDFFDYDTSDAVITFETEDASIASVSTDGTVTPVSVGETTLTVSASWNNYSGTGMVVYIPVKVCEDIEVVLDNGSEETVYSWQGTVGDVSFGNTSTYRAEVFKNAEKIDNAQVTWCTSDENIAKIEDGVLTAYAPGKVDVWCEYIDNGETYTSVKRVVEVEYPFVDTTDDSVGIFIHKDMENDRIGVSALLSSFELSDMTGDNVLQAVYSEKIGNESLLQGTEVDFTKLSYGESNLSLVGSNYGYIKSMIFATDSFENGSEFNAWQNSRAEGFGVYTSPYSYGSGEYYVLGNDITIDPPSRKVLADGSFGMSVSAGEMKIGFVGTFNGMGHTITVENAGKTGIFGDLGQGAVIKNLGLVATLSATEAKSAALASIAKGGAVIENCWFDVTTGANSDGYNGLIFAGVGKVTMRNCVVVGTPSAAGNSGLLSAYSHPDYKEGGTGDTMFKFENVIAVSKNASNMGWIWLENNKDIYDTGVTVLDGSAAPVENLKIADDFDTSGFNSEYFYIQDGYVPMWGKSETDFAPVLTINSDKTEITTEEGNNIANMTYMLSSRGEVFQAAVVSWESNAPAIAEVSDGVVTGKSEGSAEITLTVTYDGKEYSDTVTVYVTMPVEETEVELLFDKSASNTLTAEQVFGAGSEVTIEAVKYDSVTAENIYNKADGMLNLANVKAGENQAYYVVGSDHIAYKITATVATEVFYEAGEFETWQSTRAGGLNNSTAYSYGEGEYYMLGADITITAPSRGVYATGGFGAAVSNHTVKIGFVGTFNGMGHTITVENAGKTGIFGDLGQGAVIKNLGLVATLSATEARPAALASIAKGGAVIENCWFDVTAGNVNAAYNGLIFAGVGQITMRNCVVIGTPGKSGEAMSALLSGYTYPTYHAETGGEGNTVFTFENVIGISKNASNQNWIVTGADAALNGGKNYNYCVGVTVLDGSATPVENLKIADDFDTSGFNSEYFYIQDGYVPMWGKSEADFTPVLTINSDKTEITTEEGNNIANMTYTLSSRGEVFQAAVVSWKSNAPAIAEVSDGVVTGKSEGSAEITLTVTYDGKEYSDTVMVYVTMPVEETEVELLFDKSASNTLTAEQVFGAGSEVTIEAVKYDSVTAENIYDKEAGTLDLTGVKAGENQVYYVVGSDHIAYKITATVATEVFYEAGEFETWQSTRAGGTNNTTAYSYGEGEYYVLGADITITAPSRGVYATGGFGAAVSNSTVKIGFVGTFNGMGHTITVENAGKTGIFGDLGEGAVIKNLGLVATLSATEAKSAALASIAKGGAVIENCWFDVTTGANSDGYNGLIFAGVGKVTMRNCVVVGTPSAAGNSGLLSAYSHPDYKEGGTGDTVFKFENVIAVSKNASNMGWIWLENNTDIYDTGVTVIDGSAADFNLESYELEGFDVSGFNTDYFTITEGHIPQWKAIASE